MSLQATALGLQAHQMAGIDPEKARASFSIPEGYEAVTAIAVGYPGDPQTLPEKLRASETAARSRRPLADTVFTGAWGQSAGL
jgi:hypothetical protein